jgi:ATP-binding cassette subfamily B protein
MDRLKLFMSDADVKKVEANYQLDGDVYKLDLKDGMTKKKLSNIFATPEMMLLGIQEKDKSALKQLDAMVDGPAQLEKAQQELDAKKAELAGLPAAAAAAAQAQLDAAQAQLDDQSKAMAEAKTKLMAEKDAAVKKMGDLSSASLTTVGVTYLKAEYKVLKVDTKKIQLDYMTKIGTQMVLLTLLSAAASIIVGLIAALVAASVSRELRIRQYKRTLEFSNAELEKFSSASLITRNTNDIQQIQMGLVMVLRMVLYAPILGIGGIYMVNQTHTGLGWIIGVAVGAVLALVIVLMVTAMPKFKILQSLVDRVNLVSREILTGLQVIRAFTREDYEEKRFDVANTDLKKTQLFVNRAMSIMFPVMMLVMNVIVALIVWEAGHGMAKGNLQVGDMMAFITYTIQIVMAFMMISMVSIILPRANVAAGRVEEVLETEPTIRDKDVVKDHDVDFKGEVKFSGVTFAFPGAKEDVLHHISFTAKPGETTAIIGSTGSGKSTIVNLLPRFYDVTGGFITIDGVDIRDLSLHKLHELIGFVPQKGVLFSGDIESNLKFGDADVSDDDMKRAADIAQATEFISGNEEGFKRAISQGGSNVSGGQKQRLSIARAIAKNPKILVFDDSFSALDNKTDVAVRAALAKDVKDATTIIVAQKISTIMHAENIIVLNEGRIVGQGTHDELMASNETYQEIAKSQLSNSELGLEEAE